MVVNIKFSTGKEIELTDQELRELYGYVTQQQQIFVPWQYKPWTEQPYPYSYPTLTCKSI